MKRESDKVLVAALAATVVSASVFPAKIALSGDNFHAAGWYLYIYTIPIALGHVLLLGLATISGHGCYFRLKRIDWRFRCIGCIAHDKKRQLEAII